MDLNEIGLMIKVARKQKKLSQTELGQLLGMSRNTLSGIENGTIHEIGIRKVLAICAVLELELIAQPKRSRPTLRQLMNEQKNA